MTNASSNILNWKTELILVALACVGFLFLLFASTFIGNELVLVALAATPAAAYLLIKSMVRPFFWIVFMIAGSYAGNLIALAGEGSLIPISLFQVGLGGAITAMIIFRSLRVEPNVKLTGYELEFLLFVTLMYFSCIYSPAADDGLFFATRILVTGLVLYIILNTVSEIKQLQILLFTTVIIGFVLANLSLFTSLLDTDAMVQSVARTMPGISSRAALTQVDPNVFATFFFLPIAFCLCIVLSNSKLFLRAAAAGMMLVLIGGLLSTFSRSAWVSTAVIFLVTAICYKRVKLMTLMVIVGVLVLLAIPDFRYILIGVGRRLADIFAGSADESSRVRILQIYAAFGMFFDSYMMGIGLRGFSEKAFDYYSRLDTFGINEPHNVPYTIMAELGIIGLMLFTFIIFLLLRVAYMNVKLAKTVWQRAISVSLFATFLGFCMFYQFIGGGLADNNVWIILGMVFALNHIIQFGGKKQLKTYFDDKPLNKNRNQTDSPAET